MVSSTSQTFCRICHAACPVEVEIEENKVISVRGVKEDPLFKGYTCIKGRQIPDQINSQERLRFHLRKTKDGHFEEVTRVKGLDEVAKKLEEIIEQYGPSAVASYTGTGGYQSSCALATAEAWHKGIGSHQLYTSVTIDQPAKTTAPMRTGSWGAGINNFRDSDIFLAVGNNPMVSSYSPLGGLQGTDPFTKMREAKKRGMKLIVIDPRETELASSADIHLQPIPGEDPTLLAGILNVIFEESIYDHDFCDKWVEPSMLNSLIKSISRFTPEYVAKRCDVDQGAIIEAALMVANGKKGGAGTGTGPSMAPHSSLTEHLIICLNVICGRYNREGDLVESGNFLYPDSPRLAQVIPAKDPTTGPPSRFRNLRGYRGQMPCSTLADEILEPGEGQVRALIVSGGNPVVAFPDHELTISALKDLDLLVVLDHRMTATSELADFVFAPRLALERADVPHLMDRWFAAPYTNYTDAVVEADPELIAEWEFFWELACRMNTPIELSGGEIPLDHKPTDGEVIDLVYSSSRMPIEQIRENRGVVHTGKEYVVQPADPDCVSKFNLMPDGIEVEIDEVFAESTGAELWPGFDPDIHTFRLTSRRLKDVLNSLGTELPQIAARSTTNYAYMSPDDMEDLKIRDDDLIDISSPRSTITGVAKADKTLRRGIVSMAHSWGGTSLTDEKVRDIGTPTSRLTSAREAIDPINGMVVSSAIPVQVQHAKEFSSN